MLSKKKSQLEFIVLMALLMSLVAMSIDALLPALDHIGLSIGIEKSSDNQLLITMIFLGLGLGRLLFGPLSDSFGRKPAVYIGFALFVVASIICVYSKSLEVMIIGRILQGIGLSAPQTISISMVRDCFSGDYMAKIMSFIAVIFILAPVVAPAIGKIILDAYGWKAIFEGQLVFGSLIVLWFWKRQPETLRQENKKKFSLRWIISGTREFIKYREAVVFTVISGFVTGAFMVYLGASQHIFEEQYFLKEEFPYIFAGMAISVGLATLLNGMLVEKYGSFKLTFFSMLLSTITSLFYIFFFYGKQNPPIYIFLIFCSLQFFFIGFTFGNLRALAMQPVGHIAGIGAALNGFISTIIAVIMAMYIGKFVDTTALPLFMGFLACGLFSFVTLVFLRKDKIRDLLLTKK